jgi:hypothetical protein
MTQTGKVYVAPIDTEHWFAKGWTELGYTTDDWIIPTEEKVWSLPDLSGMAAAFKSVTLTFKQMADALRLVDRPGFLFFAKNYQRPERLRLLRSAYRQKRGRRRFR